MEKLEQEKEVFFKAASHELRTPLTSLSVLLENMSLNVGVYQDHETYLKKALDLVEMSNVKLKQILEVSSLETFDDESFKEINLSEMIEDILKQNKILIKEKALNSVLKCTDTALIKSNPRLLYQIFSNLITNAVQYSDNNTSIEISCDETGFSIRNICKGASALNTQSLYEPFYRHDSSKASDTNGNGLGLYIVKRNCELLNYDFELEVFKDIFKFNLYF